MKAWGSAGPWARAWRRSRSLHRVVLIATLCVVTLAGVAARPVSALGGGSYSTSAMTAPTGDGGGNPAVVAGSKSQRFAFTLVNETPTGTSDFLNCLAVEVPAGYSAISGSAPGFTEGSTACSSSVGTGGSAGGTWLYFSSPTGLAP